MNNIWYLEHPTYRYAEDVKALAREYRLVIVDPAAAADRSGEAKQVPGVTLRDEYRLEAHEEQPAAPAARLKKGKQADAAGSSTDKEAES